MSSRSAKVLVILIVTIIAFCLAGVFASMTGTYHLNLDLGNNNDTNETGFFGNETEFNSEGSEESYSSSDAVQSYSSNNYQSQSSDNEKSQVVTYEDSNPTQEQTKESSEDSGIVDESTG